MTYRLAACLAAVCLFAGPALSGPVSLGFEGPLNGPAPADMSEDGFTVTTSNMAISSPEKSGDGTDGPNEIESRMSARGQITITRPGAPFRFVSLDWQAEDRTATVIVRGFLNGTEVASDRFTSQGPSGFVTFHADALSGAALDRLEIFPQRNPLGMGALDAVILDDDDGSFQTSGAHGIPGPIWPAAFAG